MKTRYVALALAVSTMASFAEPPETQPASQPDHPLMDLAAERAKPATRGDILKAVKFLLEYDQEAIDENARLEARVAHLEEAVLMLLRERKSPTGDIIASEIAAELAKQREQDAAQFNQERNDRIQRDAHEANERDREGAMNRNRPPGWPHE